MPERILVLRLPKKVCQNVITEAMYPLILSFTFSERYERTERFIRNWCNTGMPGTKPFFEAYVYFISFYLLFFKRYIFFINCFDSLWAVMRLQVIPENLGGAGRYRIEWEFDDAVFKEAA